MLNKNICRQCLERRLIIAQASPNDKKFYRFDFEKKWSQHKVHCPEIKDDYGRIILYSSTRSVIHDCEYVLEHMVNNGCK